MARPPLYTVLMPTHYRPDIIGLAIQSVLDQTEPDFELLVVGDGPWPGTEEAVKAFDDPRIRWLRYPKAPNFGYANRNKALAESRGELVVFAADDDLMLPDLLETMARPFARAHVQWAYGQALWVSTDGIAAPELTNLSLPDELNYFRWGINSIAAGSVVYRASAFPTRTPWDESQAFEGDWRMWHQLVDAHGPDAVAVLPTPTYLHFSAGRKQGARDSRFPLLTAWLAVADRVSWWPEALRAAVPEGKTAQAVYAELINRPGWAAEARRAATAVVNRVALDTLAPRAGQ